MKNNLIEIRLQNGKIVRYINLKYSVKVEEITINIESGEKEDKHVIRVYRN